MKTLTADTREAIGRLRNQSDFQLFVRWVRDSRDELRGRAEGSAPMVPRDFLCGGMAELSEMLTTIDERKGG